MRAMSAVFLALQQISSPWWTVGSLTAGRPVTNHQDSISRAPPGTVTPVTGTPVTPVTDTPVTPIASLGLGKKNCSTFLRCQAIIYLSYVSKEAKERRELGGFIS